MPKFYSPTALRQIAINEITRKGRVPNMVNFSNTLNEKVASASKYPTASETFDIFLSYRNDDAEMVIGIFDDLVRRGYKVYLDRVMDPHLDRANVTRDVCDLIRNRLMQSQSLFYVSTDTASSSKWMPWELGFADGYRGKAAIVPVTERSTFIGVEFVTLYPKIEPAIDKLWVYDADGRSLIGTFDTWKKAKPMRKCGMPVCPISHS